MAEKQGQWFNLLPKQPCDDDSLTEPQIPASPGSPPKLLPQIPTTLPPLPDPPTQVCVCHHKHKSTHLTFVLMVEIRSIVKS